MGLVNLLYSSIFHYAFIKPGLKGIYVKINMEIFPTLYSLKLKINTIFFTLSERQIPN